MTRTLLFVDVDGVLNVGMTQGANNTLMLSAKNLALARRVQFDDHASQKSKDAAESLLSLAAVPLKGETGTLLKYMCLDSGLSELLIERVAKLIHAAGASAEVVLSSSWRHPRHAAKRKHLESKISKSLGRAFAFSDMTPTDRCEQCGADRLETIGDYLEEYCQRLPAEESLRVLVLDDFFMSQSSWFCGGSPMKTAEDISSYLQRRTSLPAVIKTVYTYDQWMIRLGQIQASIGLQMNMYLEALSFLNEEVPRSPARHAFEGEVRTPTLCLTYDEMQAFIDRPKNNSERAIFAL